MSTTINKTCSVHVKFLFFLMGMMFVCFQLDAGSVRSNIAVLVATVVASSVYALCHGH